MSGLPREVIKWLHSLDLGQPIKNPRRDFANGFLVAKVFSWYYPHVVEMHAYNNGASIQAKQSNWQQLERFFISEQLDISKSLIEGTIHSKPGAAIALIEKLYTLLTLKELHYLPSKNHPDNFTDHAYQSQLPPFARSTTTQSIKSNLASTELETEQDVVTCQMKTESIIKAFHDQKIQEKINFPERFSASSKSIQPNNPSRQDNKQSNAVEIKVIQKPPPQLFSN